MTHFPLPFFFSGAGGGEEADNACSTSSLTNCMSVWCRDIASILSAWIFSLSIGTWSVGPLSFLAVRSALAIGGNCFMNCIRSQPG